MLRRIQQKVRFAVPFIVFGSTIALGAEAWSPEKRQAVAEQSALADAYRQLYRKIADLSPDGKATLGDTIVSSSAVTIELRRLISQAQRVGRTRFYGNGDAEADLRLPLKPVFEGLAKFIAAEQLNTLRVPDGGAILQRLGSDHLMVTGRGRSPTQDELTGPPGWPGAKDAGDLPPAGWADVNPSGFKAAQRAAELDAGEHLVRMIGQLKTERSRAVADLLAAEPILANGLRQSFDGVKVTLPEWLPEQVCRVHAEVTVRAAVDRLRQLRAQPNSKSDATEAEIESIARLAGIDRLRAVGYGLPPTSAIRRPRLAAVDVDEPEWAGRSLRVSSSGTMPKGGQPSEDRAVEIATQDARIAAQLKLAEQIDVLQLPGGASAASVLDAHEELAEDILKLLSAAQVVEGPTIDRKNRRVTLTLELPLRRLWLILRQAMTSVEATTQPAP